MTGPEHYREAERCIAAAFGECDPAESALWIARAQVHATLAAAAAATLGTFFGDGDVEAWEQVLGVKTETVGRESASYTAPRHLDSWWLCPGDQIQVMAAAPDADVTWVAVSRPPLTAVDPSAQWMTIAGILRSDATRTMALELEDGSVLELVFGTEQVWARFPCEVTS